MALRINIIWYCNNVFDFCFVNINAMSLVVLKLHLSRLFSNKAYILRSVEVCKIQLPFFSYGSLLLSASVYVMIIIQFDSI